MILEKMKEEKWGYRLLAFKKKASPLSWYSHYHRLAVRLCQDSYGLHFSVTVR